MPDSKKTDWLTWAVLAIALLAVALSIVAIATDDVAAPVRTSSVGAYASTMNTAVVSTLNVTSTNQLGNFVGASAKNFSLDGGAVSVDGTHNLISITHNVTAAELNITGASTATKILCAKADGGIGQCTNNITNDMGNAGNCTCA